ncbi:MAG: alpha/beta fold hydrolase [Woeseiaceae bacterium]|nr:alpha/beta fold hydrolase [Woeseiaceae bacterium]
MLAAIVATFAASAVASAGQRIKIETIEFSSGTNKLEGVLYLPERDEPVPLLILYHAASGGSVDFPFYEHLRTTLPRVGIATFLYDRRGTNGQPGEFRTASFETLARDGIAAARFLRNHPHIDANRIGAWGVSQGGWVAPIAARLTDDVSFVISVSGPGVSPAEQMAFTSAFHIKEAGFGESVVETALDLRSRVDEYYRNPDPTKRDGVAALIDSFRREKWFHLVFLPNGGYLPDDVTTTKWYQEMDFDPTVTLRELEVPFLAIFGGKDRWVPVDASVAAIQGAVQKDILSIFVSEDSGHFMSGSPEGPNYSGEDSVEQGYIERMIHWVEGLQP